MRETRKLARELEADRAKKRKEAERRRIAKQKARAALPPLDRAVRYTIDEAALYLRCSRAYLYRIIKKGHLSTIEDGRRTYVTGEAIAARAALGSSEDRSQAA